MEYKIRFTFRKLKSADDCHLVLRGKIDEHAVHLILDTGASHSCFDIDFITKIYGNEEITDEPGIHAGVGSGNLPIKLTLLKKITLGRFSIKNYQVALIDLSHVNHVYEIFKMPIIQGVIGSDLLKSYHAIIDYQKQTLTLTKTGKR